jgi:hypothetical protein
MIADDWEVISQSFEGRLRVIEWLNLQARFVVEDGVKVIYVKGKITADEKRLPIDEETTSSF